MELSWLPFLGLFVVMFILLIQSLFSPNGSKQIDKMQKQIDELCRQTGNAHLASTNSDDTEKN